MSAFQNIIAVWQGIGLVQRVLLTTLLIACVAAGTFLTKWAGRPDMRVLYSGISAEEAGKITDKISEQNIEYELRGGGTSIYVPQQHVYQLRVDLAKEGLPGNESKGYTIFDNEGLGISPFVQNINQTRALQDEIARSIEFFDSVMNVRIHLVRPESNAFNRGKESASASVVLQLRPGHHIGQSTVAAITHMVAGGVEGLKSENVTVVNSQGQLLSSSSDSNMAAGPGTYIDYKERVEQGLARKAQEMLDTALGPGRSSIKVSAVLDMESEDTQMTVYEKGIATKEEINSTTKTVGGGDESAGTGDNESEENITTEYSLPETTTRKTKMAGKIVSLSVAAVVDLTPPVVAKPEVEEGEEAAATPAQASQPLMSVEDVKSLILTSMGKDLLKDENLSVISTVFNRPSLPEPVKGPWWESYIGLIRQGSLGILAISALLVLKMFSGGKVKAGDTAALAGLPAQENMAAALPAAEIRGQIAQALQGDPDQVRDLFNSWINEKG